MNPSSISSCWDTSGYVVDGAATFQSIECIILAILRTAIPLAGVAAFVMLLVVGFKYLTAGGDPKKAEAAQKTITFAILGLALMLGGWLILLLIGELTGVNVTQFDLGIPLAPTPALPLIMRP